MEKLLIPWTRKITGLLVCKGNGQASGECESVLSASVMNTT